MRFFMIILATALCWPSFHDGVLAGDDALPSSLLGFIKPNMPLGIRSSQSHALVTIEIFSEDQFRFAKDARDMTLEDLGRKYPQVADKAAKALAEYKSSVEAQRLRNPRAANFSPPGEPVVALEVDRGLLFCTVLHVGEDYLLVAFGADNSKKQVIAKQAVSRIRWASDELRFRNSLRRTDAQE